MIIDCVSDLHGHLPSLDGGDLLIVAGDLTASNKLDQYEKFFEWLHRQNYKKKVFICGNHDGLSMSQFDWFDAEYLQDSGTTFEGLKIWGSPWTPAFMRWHFMKHTRAELKEVWDKIPLDTDILVTHGPQWGVLDINNEGRGCGCVDLGDKIDLMPNLKLHVFGHIHEAYGHGYTDGKYMSVNASIMDQVYDPVNKPIRVIL